MQTVLKKFLYRVLTRLVPICFNFLNVLMAGNLPPLGCVCVIAEVEGRFVLLKRPGGRMVFPGGFIRWREYPAEAAQREFREETGLEVRLLDTTGAYASRGIRVNRVSSLTITFAGEVVGGTLRGGVEGQPTWLDEFEMRKLLEGHLGSMLEDYFAYRRRREQS